MAENVKTQKFTVRHFFVLFTCMICIFTSSAITFSCPGLAYRPVAMQLGIQVSDVSLYMLFTCSRLSSRQSSVHCLRSSTFESSVRLQVFS